MAFSFAPQLAFLAEPLGAISAGRQYRYRMDSVTGPSFFHSRDDPVETFALLWYNLEHAEQNIIKKRAREREFRAC